MIVTIDNYRGTASPPAAPSGDEARRDYGFNFTVAHAGDLKLKLQALNRLLIQTPLDQHYGLGLDKALDGISSRTYVNGSEEVYFTVKSVSWPSKIPEVFIKAYLDVLQGRPFTNRYIYKDLKTWTPDHLVSASARCASTFSDIRPHLPKLDIICDTNLNNFFQRADSKVKPFPFIRLPTELRLEIFDHLFPNQEPLRAFPRDKQNTEQRPPVRLDVMQVNKTLYAETTDHFFNKSTLFLEAYPDLRRGVWNQCYFTEKTSKDYAARIAGMDYKVRRKITQLEIRIIPEDAASLTNSYNPHQSNNPSLQQVFAALLNLKTVLVSFERIPERLSLVSRHPKWNNRWSYYDGQKFTLAWIHAQLPDSGPEVVWDMTHFRHPVGSAALLREEIMVQPMMRKLIERDGTLRIAQSVTATREDRQRWSEARDTVIEAIGL